MWEAVPWRECGNDMGEADQEQTWELLTPIPGAKSSGSQPLLCFLWSYLDHQPSRGSSIGGHQDPRGDVLLGPTFSHYRSLSPEGVWAVVVANAVTGM